MYLEHKNVQLLWWNSGLSFPVSSSSYWERIWYGGKWMQVPTLVNYLKWVHSIQIPCKTDYRFTLVKMFLNGKLHQFESWMLQKLSPKSKKVSNKNCVLLNFPEINSWEFFFNHPWQLCSGASKIFLFSQLFSSCKVSFKADLDIDNSRKVSDKSCSESNFLLDSSSSLDGRAKGPQ